MGLRLGGLAENLLGLGPRKSVRPIEVRYATSRLSPPNMMLVMVLVGTGTRRSTVPSGA